MKTNQIEIHGIVYTFRQANFMEAKNQAMKLVSLAKGGFTKEDEETTFDIGQLISNLSSPETQSVENFIIKYAEAKNEMSELIQLNKPKGAEGYAVEFGEKAIMSFDEFKAEPENQIFFKTNP